MSFPILCNTDYVVVFIFSLKYISHPVPSPDLSFQPDEHLEVYVSTSENPHHFWIQILGLDKLTAEMSRFYNNGTLQVSHCLCSLDAKQVKTGKDYFVLSNKTCTFVSRCVPQ